MQDLDHLLPEIVVLAERAGAVILEHYHGDVAVRAKADASPVTAADEAAEAVILAGLAELTPKIPVVAEETVAAGHVPEIADGPFWLVDPLDGTKEFLSKNGEFTVNIALVQAREPVLGVVLAPARAHAWWGARGKGAKARDADGNVRAIAVRRAPARPRRDCEPLAPRSRDPGLSRPGRHHRVHLGWQLAQVLPGRRRQGGPLSAFRPHHGMGCRGRARGARGRRGPGHHARWRAFPLSQAGLREPAVHRAWRLSGDPADASGHPPRRSSAAAATSERRSQRYQHRAASHNWPALAATGHGAPMRDQELRHGLNRLIRQFDRIAVPEHGRYVR